MVLTKGFNIPIDPSLNLELYLLYLVILEIMYGTSTITKLIDKDSGINNITEDSKITILLDRIR